MTRSVVTNAGPLMALAKLNALHILKQLYGHVNFPRSVYEETVVTGIRRGYSDADTLRVFLTQHAWEPSDIKNIPQDVAVTFLDRGEKEAIALALSYNALLLMDEEHGREIARQKHITVKGTLGILVEAYQKQIITEDQLRLYVEQIRKRHDIWISPTLCSHVLALALQSGTP